MSLLELFCDVDDFCITATKWTNQQILGQAKVPEPKLAASEITTIIIYFHMARFRDFKAFYTWYVICQSGHAAGSHDQVSTTNRHNESPTGSYPARPVPSAYPSYTHTRNIESRTPRGRMVFLLTFCALGPVS